MAALQDRRRILGPVDAISVTYETTSDLLGTLREDARTRDPEHLQRIFLQPNLVVNASGSCFYEAGGIRLQCTVHGPRPIRGSFTDRAAFNVEVKLAPFIVDPANAELLQKGQGQGPTSARPNGTSVLEREMAAFIQNSLSPAILLEAYPKSTIDLFVNVIECGLNSKALYAAGVNAASTALVDADIVLRDVVTAGAAVIPLGSVSKPYADPEYRAQHGDLSAVVSYMTASNKEVVGMAIDGGALTEVQMNACLDTTLDMAESARALINRVLIMGFRAKEQALLKVAKEQAEVAANEDSMEVDA
ncbi:hypothetical protein DV451_001418 [Geotrichum candidum]|uniref:Exoribonuclease phosphorolytic domain-containing protein n=1 Tax=Geotrichum candidum TaxID=1173061 RepID=A0A9P5G7V9_GEOCN|nr:hypothetical protein DV451_001418 [Geotrichum candidum]